MHINIFQEFQLFLVNSLEKVRYSGISIDIQNNHNRLKCNSSTANRTIIGFSGGYRYQVVPESLIPRYNGLFVHSELWYRLVVNSDTFTKLIQYNGSIINSKINSNSQFPKTCIIYIWIRNIKRNHILILRILTFNTLKYTTLR